MGEGFIEGDAHAHTVGIPRYGGAKELFEAGFAGAEQDELDIALHQQVEDGFNQIEPLLRGQARDHPDNRRMVVIGEFKDAPEPSFTLIFQRQTLLLVMGRDEGIGPGIPQAVIDPVENADEIGRTRPHDTLETKALRSRHDFLGIGRTHRGDFVRQSERSLEKINIAVKFQELWREKSGIEIQ